jgi:hypothetical protein
LEKVKADLTAKSLLSGRDWTEQPSITRTSQIFIQVE